MNYGIADELSSVWYSSFIHAVKMVPQCGQGIKLTKCNIKSAFCLLPVYPDDFNLLGFCFDGQFSTFKKILEWYWIQ